MRKLTPEASLFIEEVLQTFESLPFEDGTAVATIIDIISCIKGEKKCDQGIAENMLYTELSAIGNKTIAPQQIKDLMTHGESGLLLQVADNILTFENLSLHWLDLCIKQGVFGKEYSLSPQTEKETL